MKNLKIIIGLIVVVAIVFLIGKSSYKTADEKKQLSDTNQVSTLEVKANDWVAGNPDAKVTLIEYLDFECEACGAYYPITTKLKEEYKNDIKFVVRYFPLPGHRNSRTAAYSVEAAGKQNKFWEMYDLVFKNQKEWGEQQAPNQEQFEKYAIEAGVNIEQWRQDVKSSEVMDRVDASYKEAVSLNLQGTPSFFLDGKRIQNPKGYESFKLLIDEAIKN